MTAVLPIPWVPAHYFDDDGEPLAGGQLYAYEAGTDTPMVTYEDPEGTVVNTHPVNLDDSGYANIYLLAGRAYKLRLTDHLGVQQWEVDNVQGGGGASGLGVAGMGVGSSTVAVSPGASAAQASAAVFPPDTLGVALTLWVDVSLGTSQGLTHVGVGTSSVPDRWGVLQASQGHLTAGYESTSGVFGMYSGQPHPLGAEPITLTAYGGRFDGTGRVYLTGHYLTFRPNHQEGAVYLPGLPGDTLPQAPLPLATEEVPGIVELIDANAVLQDADLTRAVTIGRLVSRTATETRVGLVELATSAETTTGTDLTRATHPAGVKAALDARLPASGTALTVVRYASSGQTLESAPALLTTSSGQLQVGSAVSPLATNTTLGVERDNGTQVVLTGSGMTGSTNASGLIMRTSRSALATPQPLQSGDLLGYLGWAGWQGSAYSPNQIVVQGYAEETWSSSTMGTSLRVATTATGSSTRVERLRIDASGNVATQNGNLGVGTLMSATLGSGASYQQLSVKGSTLWTGQSSLQERALAQITTSFVVSTDATRTGRATLSVFDATAGREILRGETSGTAPLIGFLGAAAVARQTLAVAATDAATTQTLANSLRTALINLGLGV